MSRVFRSPHSQLVDITGELVHDFYHGLFWECNPTSFKLQGQQVKALIAQDRESVDLFFKFSDGTEAVCTLERGRFTLLTELWPRPFAWFCSTWRPVDRQHQRTRNYALRWKPDFRPEWHRFWYEIPDTVASRTRGALAEQHEEADRRARFRRQDRKRKRRL
jgi:hypothetical protein